VILGIDHLVIAVRSVEAATAELERVVGLAVTGGGRHEGMGTRNALAFLGDTYVELIGIEDEGVVRSNPAFAVGNAALVELEAGRQGLATFALAVDDVAAEVSVLREAGSSVSSPVAGARRRADGEDVRWSTAFPPRLGPEAPPFLIEHELAGAEWGPEARAARADQRHPAGGVVRLVALELPTADAARLAKAYGRVVGVAFSEAWRASVGPSQSVVLREGEAAPVVELTADPGTAPLDVDALGVRWHRIPRGA
jgi:hypothetical protein